MKAKSKGTGADCNTDWEKKIAEFDAELERQEREYREHYLVVTGNGHQSLTEEENEVLTLFLEGVSLDEIAKPADVDVDTIAGLIEVIRAKLSVT